MIADLRSSGLRWSLISILAKPVANLTIFHATLSAERCAMRRLVGVIGNFFIRVLLPMQMKGL